MKKFSKLNRGILLGCVVLIGLIIFIIIDNTSFKKEMPTVEKTIEKYISDALSANVTDGTTKKDNYAIFKNKLDSVIDLYWTSNGTLLTNIGYGYGYEDIKNVLPSDPNNIDFSLISGNIKSTDFEINSYTIKKNGPGCALGEINYSITFHSTGIAPYVTPSGDSKNLLGNYDDMSSFSKNDIKKLKDGKSILNVTYNYTSSFHLSSESGKWKIYQISDDNIEINQEIVNK